jgi:hypothetical protein
MNNLETPAFLSVCQSQSANGVTDLLVAVTLSSRSAAGHVQEAPRLAFACITRNADFQVPSVTTIRNRFASQARISRFLRFTADLFPGTACTRDLQPPCVPGVNITFFNVYCRFSTCPKLF